MVATIPVIIGGNKKAQRREVLLDTRVGKHLLSSVPDPTLLRNAVITTQPIISWIYFYGTLKNREAEN
jgi:hypothetical protein